MEENKFENSVTLYFTVKTNESLKQNLVDYSDNEQYNFILKKYCDIQKLEILDKLDLNIPVGMAERQNEIESGYDAFRHIRKLNFRHFDGTDWTKDINKGKLEIKEIQKKYFHHLL